MFQWLSYRKNYIFHGGHFEIQDGYPKQESTSYFIGFLDRENIGMDTKIMSLRVSSAEIWSKVGNLAAILKSTLYGKSKSYSNRSPKFF